MNTYSRRRVLAVIDLGPGSQHVVNAAADIARAKGASFTLLHVLDYEPPVGADFPAVSPGDECDALVQLATGRLRSLAAASGTPAEVRVVVGSPASEVDRMADELGADLVVFGSWRARLAALLGIGADCLSAPERAWGVVRV